jgi:hypothetical protein
MESTDEIIDKTPPTSNPPTNYMKILKSPEFLICVFIIILIGFCMLAICFIGLYKLYMSYKSKPAAEPDPKKKKASKKKAQTPTESTPLQPNSTPTSNPGQASTPTSTPSSNPGQASAPTPNVTSPGLPEEKKEEIIADYKSAEPHDSVFEEASSTDNDPSQKVEIID